MEKKQKKTPKNLLVDTIRKMAMRRRSSVLFLLLLLTDGAHGAVTCKATTTIEQTTVTCHFGIDISKTSHNFNVQYYPPHSKSDPESVLMCNWKAPTELTCKQSSDVTFDQVVSNQITLHRWPSVGNWGSRYVCQLVPSTGDPLDPCELTFSKIKTTTTATSTTARSSLLGDIYESSGETRTLSILAFTFSVILLVLLVVLVVIYFCRHRIKEKIAALRKPKGKEDGIETEVVELAPPTLYVQVEPPEVTENDKNAEEEKSRWWLRFTKRSGKKEKSEDAKEPMLAERAQRNPQNFDSSVPKPGPPAVIYQKSAPEEPSISMVPAKKESQKEKKAREAREKKEKEEDQRKQREAEEMQRRAQAAMEEEQRQQREAEEMKRREIAAMEENKKGKKNKK